MNDITAKSIAQRTSFICLIFAAMALFVLIFVKNDIISTICIICGVFSFICLFISFTVPTEIKTKKIHPTEIV